VIASDADRPKDAQRSGASLLQRLSDEPDAGGTAALAQRLRDMEDRLRRADTEKVVADEPSLSAGSAPRRAAKRRQFRATRPVSRRSDRLSADLAGLAAQLAERLAATEQDVVRMQGMLAEMGEAAAPTRRRDEPGGRPSATIDDDRYYWAFESRMRGSTQTVVDKLARHEEPLVRVRSKSGQDHPLWLDLGCGKGEFLTLLQGWGFSPRGVDISLAAVQSCRSGGFDVALAEAVEFLSDYEGPSPVGISAVQVIEHLPRDRWLTFFEQSRRVLAPGGTLLVETINPLNVAALSSSFFADITHTWPTHPEAAKLMASHAGFENVRVEFLNEDDAGAARDFVLWAEAP
jgi:SAM-dependent methyltransferase